MSATFNKFRPFIEDIFEKVHDLGADALKYALTATANTPVNTNRLLGDLTQISYTNLSSRAVTTSSSAQTTGTYKLVIGDVTLTASGGAVAAFQFIVLYNDTPTSPADPLVGWWDYGSAVTLNDGETFTLDADATNGILQAA